MTENKTSSEPVTETPATDADTDQGETKKVDTAVQEDAAKEREKSGGYQ